MDSTSAKTDPHRKTRSASTPARSSSTRPARDGDGEQDAILVANVVRPHALRGAVKIEIHSDVAERFARGSELWLAAPGKPRRQVRVASFRPERGGGVIRFDGIDDRNAAETLRGARLEVSRSSVPEAPEGVYYHFELIDCHCRDAEHGDLGTVRDVLEDGGGVLLEIDDGERRLLVPFVEHFLQSVDVEERQILLRLPAGLLETCVSKS